MLQKVDFQTNEDLPSLIKELTDKGFTLIEVQNHFDGNHILYEDNKPVRDPLAEIDKLKADYNTLKAKVDILEKK